MFMVKETDFSGLGVFSTRNLPAGTLIMREKPLLEVDPQEMSRESLDMQNITLERHKGKGTNKKTTAIKVVKFCKVMETFMKLENNAKRQYLSLKDSFIYLNNVEEFKLDIDTIDVSIVKEIISVSREVAAKVWGIFNTNNFENGVFFHLSRINHSCSPNSEFVWNSEEKTQDLRAVEQIELDEEITANYADLEDGLNKKFRQEFIKNNFRFDCVCSSCCLLEMDADKDENIRSEIMKLHHLLKVVEKERKKT